MEFNTNSKKLFKILGVLIIMYIFELFYLHYTNIILKVDGRDITKTQFNEGFEKNANTSGFLSLGINIKKDKKNAIYVLVKDKTVDDLIKQTLIDKEIEKRHINATKEEIDKEIQKAIVEYGSKEKLKKALEENEISTRKFKNDLSESIKRAKLAESISKSNVTDADIKKYYRENILTFNKPEKIRLSHILFAANPKMIEQKIKAAPENQGLNENEIKNKINAEIATKQEQATEIYVQLKKNPKLFTSLAKEKSEDKLSANRGGDLGYFSQEEFIEPFASTMSKLKPNTISDLVKSPYGYHIFVITEKTKAVQEPIERVKDQIIATLKQEQQDKILDDFAESLKKKAKIEYKNPEYEPKTTASKK